MSVADRTWGLGGWEGGRLLQSLASEGETRRVTPALRGRNGPWQQSVYQAEREERTKRTSDDDGRRRERERERERACNIIVSRHENAIPARSLARSVYSCMYVRTRGNNSIYVYRFVGSKSNRDQAVSECERECNVFLTCYAGNSHTAAM